MQAGKVRPGTYSKSKSTFFMNFQKGSKVRSTFLFISKKEAK
jgi:hypothetical protein